MRCCYSTNKVVNISSCGYTGQRFLAAPWDTEVRTNYALEPRQVIQGIGVTFVTLHVFIAVIVSFSMGFQQARICQYDIVDVNIEAGGDVYTINESKLKFRH